MPSATMIPAAPPGSYGGPPAFVPPGPPATWPPQSSGPAQAALPRPVFRGQAPDDGPPLPPVRTPRPAPLTMPSPEQLGLTADTPGIDWSAAHRRLDHLGAICFHVDKVSRGCRVTCLLPTATPGRTHHIEAEAAIEAEAVRLVLDRAEAWAAGR